AACIAVPMLVRKKTYSTPATAAAAANDARSVATSRVLTSQPIGCNVAAPNTDSAQDSAIDAIVRSDRSGRLLLPITCRLTEYNAVMTRIPDSRPLILNFVWSSPVVAPAAAPARNAAPDAITGLTWATMSTAAT